MEPKLNDFCLRSLPVVENLSMRPKTEINIDVEKKMLKELIIYLIYRSGRSRDINSRSRLQAVLVQETNTNV